MFLFHSGLCTENRFQIRTEVNEIYAFKISVWDLHGSSPWQKLSSKLFTWTSLCVTRLKLCYIAKTPVPTKARTGIITHP